MFKDIKIIKCETLQQKEECYKIRYKVFTEEKKFELENNTLLETDIHDSNSQHFIIYNYKTKEYIATIRVIKNSDILNKYDTYKKVDNFCEISRLAIINKYRKQSNSLLLLLYITCFAHIIKSEYQYIVFFIEKKLNRLLNIMKLKSEVISDDIIFNGVRNIYLLNSLELLENMNKDIQRVYKSVYDIA